MPLAMAVLGVGGAALGTLCIAPLWQQIGWRQPVAEWLRQAGFSNSIVSFWGLICHFSLDWLVAGALGVVVGFCTLKSKRWLLASLSTGSAYVLTPYVCAVYCGMEDVAMSLFSSVRVFLWQGLPVLCAVLSAATVHLLARLFRETDSPARATPSGN